MILIIVVAYLTFLPNYTESTFPCFPVSHDISRNFLPKCLVVSSLFATFAVNINITVLKII